MSPKQLFMLLLLAALWGASFLFIRVAAPALGPFLTIEGRVVLATLCLMIFAFIGKKPLSLKAYWPKLAMMGLLNAAIPFTLIANAQLHISASFASILNATTPLFAALIASFWLKEKLSFKRSFGLFLGVLGVAILVGWSPMPLDKATLIALFSMLGATFFYGLAGVYAKQKLKHVPTLTAATGQQLAASLWLLIPSTLNMPEKAPAMPVIFAVVALAVLCTALAYLLYFSLISSVGPTKTLTVTYLIPLFGATWGVLFLKETVTLGMLVGLVVILSSVFLVNEVKLKRLRPARA